jgi:hypothetical protein
MGAFRGHGGEAVSGTLMATRGENLMDADKGRDGRILNAMPADSCRASAMWSILELRDRLGNGAR